MEIHEYNCPKCGKKGVPFLIEYSPRRALFIITLKCPKHKFKFKVKENKIKEYLNDIIRGTLICPYCGASGLEYQVLNISIISQPQPALHLLKLCTRCRIKSPSILKNIVGYTISNILYTRFYDEYFLLLKNQESPELIRKYLKTINCPDCKSDIIINDVILENNMGYILGKCSGPTQHIIQISLPLEEQYNWLTVLPQFINKCQYCNSKDLILKELNFQNYDNTPFPKYYHSENRIITRICKKCGKKNLTHLHHSFYEIYRRILGKREHKQLHKTQLFCPKCNAEALFGSLRLKETGLRLVQLCKNRHITKKILKQEEKLNWIDQVLSGVKYCKKCWSPNQRVRGVKFLFPHWGGSQIENTKIKLQCLDCKNKRVIVINNLIFDEMMDFLFSE